MKFRTKYDKQDPIYTSAGKRFKPQYGAQLDKYGNRIIVEGKVPIDMKMFINSHAKECDLNILLAKYQNGDTNALMQRAAMFMDITGIPDNINDVLNLKTQAEKVFAMLPAKAKEAFGNNVNNWLSNMNTKEWIDIMSQSEDSLKKDTAKNAKLIEKVYKDNVQPVQQNQVSEIIENPAVDEPVVQDDAVTKTLRMLGGKK